MTESSDHPGVIAPPPLLYGGAFFIALLLHWLWPLPIFPQVSALWTGLVLIALAVALAISGRQALVAAGTNVNPYKPSTAVVASGPYRFTRNPLYVSLTVMLLGLTLGFNSWWGLVLLIPLLLVMHFGVILREERYLERKFGDDYRRYRSAVRRYL
jgi:protein-S-isoprenylcysteine O-methyltransferase Ste14